MPIYTLDLGGIWKLTNAGLGEGEKKRLHLPSQNDSTWMNAPVPGDVHPVLVEAGRLPDPFHGLNVNQCAWVARTDWWYRRQFKVPAKWRGKPVRLVFDGLDTFAHIYLNGRKVAETDNMFRQHRFDVTDAINYGETNTIAVCIRGPIPVLEARDSSKYFGCFYRPRIFARKTQCHFSWDWAPPLPAIGIWQDVRLEAADGFSIEDVHIATAVNGDVTFRVALDLLGRRPVNGAQYIVTVEVHDGQKRVAKACLPAAGASVFLNLRVPNPKLWWPNGYGEPHLYRYTVTLHHAAKTVDTRTGRFGIRQAGLVEPPVDTGRMGFAFRINGVDVFSLGANWVPADCFPALAGPQRYRRLIRLAKEAGFNMLRVWGGGLYEKDVFYDLCDENGIMVWQDLMFACSDIPDDDPHFAMSLIPEFEHQVRRLRNHPCIVHWCGSNEKTGAFGLMKNYGDRIVRHIGRGVVNDLMPESTYTPSSPYSYTDIGNDPESGDSHGGCYEQAFLDDIRRFRDHIARTQTMFNSEFGMHGPCHISSIKKFIPEDRLWPLNEVWEAHVQDNPYNTVEETFVQLQEKCAAALFHAPASAHDFVKVAGTVQAEILREEMEHHRRRFPENGGALVWMLNDCWPCASWSLVDYYGLAKQAYYAIKRACAPTLASFKKVRGGFDLYLTTNLLDPAPVRVSVEVNHVRTGLVARFPGRRVKLSPHESRPVCRINARNVPKKAGVYLCARIQTAEGQHTVTWFPHLWRNVPWPEPDLSLQIVNGPRKDGEFAATAIVTAAEYARCVNLHFDDDAPCYFSDNFFDLIPGETRKVDIRSERNLDLARIRLRHWLTDWD